MHVPPQNGVYFQYDNSGTYLFYLVLICTILLCLNSENSTYGPHGLLCVRERVVERPSLSSNFTYFINLFIEEMPERRRMMSVLALSDDECAKNLSESCFLTCQRISGSWDCEICRKVS
jgi:hypothetical protein